MLRLNTILAQPGATHKRKRLGRGPGSGHGQTSGKGDKGQLARAGGSVRPGFEGGQMPLYRRIPKRGFNNIHRKETAILNLGDLDRIALQGSLGEISLQTLVSGNLIKGRYERLTILGNGEVTKAHVIKAHRVSASAKDKIEKAGGTLELIAPPKPIPRHTRSGKGKK